MVKLIHLPLSPTLRSLMHRPFLSMWNKMLTQLILNCSQHLWLQGASTVGEPLGSWQFHAVLIHIHGVTCWLLGYIQWRNTTRQVVSLQSHLSEDQSRHTYHIRGAHRNPGKDETFYNGRIEARVFPVGWWNPRILELLITDHKANWVDYKFKPASVFFFIVSSLDCWHGLLILQPMRAYVYT